VLINGTESKLSTKLLSPPLLQRNLRAQNEAVLVDLYEATDGLNWNNNNNWLSGCFCGWHGVTCVGFSDPFDYWTIKRLELPNNLLKGTLPSSILSALKAIESLDLSNNLISGSMPTELGLLSVTQNIDLSGNSITGKIPSELGNLVNLQNIDLSRNLITGKIPSQLGNLVNIRKIDVSDNALTGLIPSSIGLLTKLETLEVQLNANLTGGMPKEICALHESWTEGSGNLENIIGDCTIGTCDALGIGGEAASEYPCPCTCCVEGNTPCCFSRSSSNCTAI